MLNSSTSKIENGYLVSFITFLLFQAVVVLFTFSIFNLLFFSQAVVILSAASCHAGLLGAGTGEANTTRFVIKDFVLTFSSGEGSCAAAPFRLLFIPKLLLSLQSKMFLLLVYKIQLSLQS